ncbi:hypothetical protein [Campylobacter fetus]|uniref:hypothetical protein n=1 Tax=Campylobacter fetus TaxID=196 RepID=UPI000FCBA996|nr:hypothetical protein [Campylobacter fetus]RUT50946.1 hypothetical protein BWK67_00035 [Campylobacter fetus]
MNFLLDLIQFIEENHIKIICLFFVLGMWICYRIAIYALPKEQITKYCYHGCISDPNSPIRVTVYRNSVRSVDTSCRFAEPNKICQRTNKKCIYLS